MKIALIVEGSTLELMESLKALHTVEKSFELPTENRQLFTDIGGGSVITSGVIKADKIETDFIKPLNSVDVVQAMDEQKTELVETLNKPEPEPEKTTGTTRRKGKKAEPTAAPEPTVESDIAGTEQATKEENEADNEVQAGLAQHNAEENADITADVTPVKEEKKDGPKRLDLGVVRKVFTPLSQTHRNDMISQLALYNASGLSAFYKSATDEEVANFYSAICSIAKEVNPDLLK